MKSNVQSLLKISPSILLVFILAFCYSCKKTKNNLELPSQQSNPCNFINQLIEDDQKYRGDERIIDPFFAIIDSMKKAEGISRDKYVNEYSREDRLAYGKRARAIANKHPIDSLLADSLMKLQTEIDHKNTKALITYTKKNGYPTNENTNCDKSPDLIFLHSPEKYWKELKQLIKSEFKKGSINKTQAGLWLRHVEGRKNNDIHEILEKNEIIQVSG
ncbi:hypothetical protein LX95_01169 [Mesonia algae]|uniref:Uncharacterized protein n=1 Tax=Mesonia algae TaxID=213248 RepID=A0A2W7I3N4_9FLAO|nr:hypothetical protein [Mesonia algae]PZW41491.1 hypothetical protein LX95_01169 [Mesonia algae]